MRGKFIVLAAMALVLLAGSCNEAEDRGTAAEAQGLVEKAVARFQEAGLETTFAEINDPKGPFIDRDLYVFVIGPGNLVVAHGADPARIGLDVMAMADEDGKAYGQEMVAVPAEGKWVDYKYKHPLSGKVEPKSAWIKPEQGFFFGCGYYKS